jgi:hypothetical protein
MKWHRMRDKVRKQWQHFRLLDFVYIVSHLNWNAVQCSLRSSLCCHPPFSARFLYYALGTQQVGVGQLWCNWRRVKWKLVCAAAIAGGSSYMWGVCKSWCLWQPLTHITYTEMSTTTRYTKKCSNTVVPKLFHPTNPFHKNSKSCEPPHIFRLFYFAFYIKSFRCIRKFSFLSETIIMRKNITFKYLQNTRY